LTVTGPGVRIPLSPLERTNHYKYGLSFFYWHPPTLVLVGSGEILSDDSKSIYNKIARQQTKTKLSIYDKQNHIWMLENIHTEASKTAMKEIQEFNAV